MSKFVTISIKQNCLRINIGKEAMLHLGSMWLNVDLDSMTIHNTGPLLVNGRNSVYLHGVKDMNKYTGKHIAVFDGYLCHLQPYKQSKPSEKPYVSITAAGEHRLRFRISNAVMAEMKGKTHIEVDLLHMGLIPFTEENKTVRAVKITDRNQFVVHQVDNISRYTGRYMAQKEGVVWRLYKMETHNPSAKLALEPKNDKGSRYPYAISFPDYEIIDGLFKMI